MQDRWISVDETPVYLVSSIKRDKVYNWIARNECRPIGWIVYGNSARNRWTNGLSRAGLVKTGKSKMTMGGMTNQAWR